jgi:hypothetical protein
MSERVARADALLRLAQVQGAAPPPSSTAPWTPYAGGEAILLAIVLLVTACGFAYAGKRLRAPLAITLQQLSFSQRLSLLNTPGQTEAEHLYIHSGSRTCPTAFTNTPTTIPVLDPV